MNAVIHKHSKIRSALLIASLLMTSAAVAQITNAPDTRRAKPPGLEHVGIDQLLGQQVPLDLQFRDETGKTVKLGDYFKSGKPVIVNLVYYQCPMLCGEVL